MAMLELPRIRSGAIAQQVGGHPAQIGRGAIERQRAACAYPSYPAEDLLNQIARLVVTCSPAGNRTQQSG
jgi:hypothetical protein